MLDDGATVKAWDPVGVKNYKKIYPDEIQYCNTLEEALRDARYLLYLYRMAGHQRLKAG